MAKSSKAGASIGGLYIWTQRDFNNMMSQLTTIQATLNSLSNRIAAIAATQNVLQGNLQAVQTSMQSVQRNVQSSLTELTAQEASTMSALDDLTAAVTATANAEQSAITLIQGLAQQIKDAVASNDTAALTALANQLSASAADLAAAVTANTPAAPADTTTPADQPAAGA